LARFLMRHMERIYIFSPIPYAFLHQRPQKLADQFLMMSIPVTYVEPSGLRDSLRKSWVACVRAILASLGYHILALMAILIPMLTRKTTVNTPRGRSRKDLEIIPMPPVIPHNRFNSEWLERLNAAVCRQALRRRVFRIQEPAERSIAIFQNPFWGLVLQQNDFFKIYYDCIDELSIYAGRSSRERFSMYESKLVDQSNGVFVTAKILEDSLLSRYGHKPIYRIPNGVDYLWFQDRVRDYAIPEDMMNLPRPVVGYIGALYSWLNYDLIVTMARRLPGISFVFIGPVENRETLHPLSDIPNIYWLGRKEYHEVPRYIQSFDVCMIPFLVNRISETANPVKLFEYLALGKPVVATRLAELERYKNGLVYLAGTDEDFIAAIRAAIEEQDPEKSYQRREIAKDHSWQKHAATMMAVFNSEGR